MKASPIIGQCAIIAPEIGKMAGRYGLWLGIRRKKSARNATTHQNIQNNSMYCMLMGIFKTIDIPISRQCAQTVSVFYKKKASNGARVIYALIFNAGPRQFLQRQASQLLALTDFPVDQISIG